MSTKVKWVVSIIISILVISIGIGIFTLWNKGFVFLTYTTNNKVEKQLEEILQKENSNNYDNLIRVIGYRKLSDKYLGFFEVKDNNEGEVFIVTYNIKGNFGKNIVLNLERIVKGDNSIVMIDEFSTDVKNIILAGPDKEKYAGLNILDAKSDKILKEVDFEKDEEKDYISEKLNQKYFVIEYSEAESIKLELIKKSGN